MTNYLTSVPQNMRTTYQHPWYTALVEQENTTTSEFQSKPKQSKEEIGLKYIDELHVAYLAGIFDGEGCLYNNEGNNSWSITLIMTDLDVVQDFAAYVKANVREFNPTSSKDYYKQSWQCAQGKRSEIFRIVCSFYPYLCARRRAKCDLFLKWYADKTGKRYD